MSYECCRPSSESNGGKLGLKRDWGFFELNIQKIRINVWYTDCVYLMAQLYKDECNVITVNVDS